MKNNFLGLLSVKASHVYVQYKTFQNQLIGPYQGQRKLFSLGENEP